MDQLIEVLQQIQDLAGIALDALKEAVGGGGDKGAEGGPPNPGEGGQAPGPESAAPPAAA